jgi:predicted secreted protein
MVQENGDVVRLAPDGPAKIGEQRVGRLVLDGDVILPADGTTMNARRRMAVNGVIAVAVPLNDSGRLAGDVAVMLEGIPVEEDRDAFLARAAAAAEDAASGTARDEAQLTEAVRLAVPPGGERIYGQEADRPGDDRAGIKDQDHGPHLGACHLHPVLDADLVRRAALRHAHGRGSGRQVGAGHAESAPHDFRFGRIMLRTTIVSAVLFGLFYLNYIYGWVGADVLDWVMPRL